MARRAVENLSCCTKFDGDCSVENSVNWSYVVSFFIYSIKNLKDKLPITLPANYSTKHYKDDNTTGSNRL